MITILLRSPSYGGQAKKYSVLAALDQEGEVLLNQRINHTHPDVEFHNKRAERQIRPMVVSRKVSFGSNTHKGHEDTA